MVSTALDVRASDSTGRADCYLLFVLRNEPGNLAGIP